MLTLAVLASTVGLCCSSTADYNADITPAVDRLLQPASQLQKAESADCGAVKHLAKADDKCQFVTEHCAGGGFQKEHAILVMLVNVLPALKA